MLSLEMKSLGSDGTRNPRIVVKKKKIHQDNLVRVTCGLV